VNGRTQIASNTNTWWKEGEPNKTSPASGSGIACGR
jgi:hypothetical protein